MKTDGPCWCNSLRSLKRCQRCHQILNRKFEFSRSSWTFIPKEAILPWISVFPTQDTNFLCCTFSENVDFSIWFTCSLTIHATCFYIQIISSMFMLLSPYTNISSNFSNFDFSNTQQILFFRRMQSWLVLQTRCHQTLLFLVLVQFQQSLVVHIFTFSHFCMKFFCVLGWSMLSFKNNGIITKIHSVNHSWKLVWFVLSKMAYFQW